MLIVQTQLFLTDFKSTRVQRRALLDDPSLAAALSFFTTYKVSNRPSLCARMAFLKAC